MKKFPQGASKIVYIGELFALAVVIAVIIYFLQFRTTDSENANTNSDQNANSAILDSTNTAAVPQDDDHDGLSNDEENRLGTQVSAADSDNDGLIDYDEVIIYKSDPLKADTDGDGNTDGQEVANGYSPISDSKLLDFEKEKEKFN